MPAAVSLMLQRKLFNLPDVAELVGLIEDKSFKKRGLSFKKRTLSLTDDAKSLLAASIASVINSEHFNGFKSIDQMANAIFYDLVGSDISSHEVDAKMLVGYSKESDYIRRMKNSNITEKMPIGFITDITNGIKRDKTKKSKTIDVNSPTEEHSNEK